MTTDKGHFNHKKIIRVYVIKYLRSEVKFDGLEALRVQLGKDKEDSLAIL